MRDMGKLELEARTLRRKGYIRQALLAAIGISGLLLVGAAAPNVIQVLDKLAPDKYKLKYRLKGTTSRLVSLGQIRFVDRGGKRYMEITEKGRRVLEMERQKRLLTERAGKRWDKKWRMVMFDIPERRRKTRDTLRIALRTFGFYQLQGSVWIYPYDCEEIVTLIKADIGTGYAVLYAIVEKIENDERVKRHFSLV